MALKSYLFFLSLLLLAGVSYGSSLNENQEDEAVWKITRDTQSLDHSVSRNLMFAIESYRRNNDDRYPTGFVDLDNEIISQLERSLGKPIEEQFKFITEHDALRNEYLEDWRLVMIAKYSLDIGRSDDTTGRHLVYADPSGELKHITETEDWFSDYIGDAIPGIAFGESSSVEQPASEVPSTPASPEVVEIASEPLAVESAVNEPVQVAPVEVIGETPEEATNWLLWLIGALVVLGGLAVVVRRKS